MMSLGSVRKFFSPYFENFLANLKITDFWSFHGVKFYELNVRLPFRFKIVMINNLFYLPIVCSETRSASMRIWGSDGF